MLVSDVGRHGTESPPPSKRPKDKRHAQIDAEHKRTVRRAGANLIVSEARHLIGQPTE